MSRERDTEQTLSPVRPAADAPARGSFRGGGVESGFGPLAPRSAGEILDQSVELLRGRFALLVGLCTLVWLPVRLLQPLVGPQAWGGPQDFNDVLGQLAGTMITTLGAALAQTLSTAIVAILVFGAVHGERLGAGAALSRALRRMPGVLVIALVTGIAAGIGVLMCILPYFYVAWKFTLAPSIYVIEDVSLSESLRRSFTLSVGTFLRWAALMIVMFVLVTPFSGLAGAVDVPAVHEWLVDVLRSDRAVVSAGLVVLTSLFMGIASAASGVIVTVFYVDCVVRREGRDLRARLSSLSASSAGERVSLLARAPGART